MLSGWDFSLFAKIESQSVLSADSFDFEKCRLEMAQEMDVMRGQVASITQKWQGQNPNLSSDMG